MSTLKTNNIEHLDASSPSIQTTIGGGVIFAGLSTFVGNTDFVGNAEFDGNVNIAGTITYDDVTNIDSVGIITAQSGIHVGPLSGIACTITSAGAITAIGDATFRDVYSRDVIGEQYKANRSGTSNCFVAQSSGVDKVIIKADGTILSGADPNDGAGVGAKILNTGIVQVARASGSAASAVWMGYTENTSTATSRINANGDATFRDLTTRTINSSDQVIANRSGTSNCFKAQSSGVDKAVIQADGAATFAGNVVTGDADYTSTGVAGVEIFAGGYINAQRIDTGSSDAHALYQGYHGNVQTFSVTASGAATFAGALSKGSGSFKISHPLPAKTATHNLVHSFIEGPQADLIYSGMVTLVAGQAEINLDTAARMTEGTFLLLNTNLRRFVSNEGGWTAVKSSITGNVLTVEAQDDTCTDEVFWTVIGERKDQHMLDTEWTDENGRVITEPLKSVEED